MVLRHLRDPDFELYCLIDSQVGLQLIADSARSLGLQRPVKLLVEIGASGGRTGVRSLSEALDLTRAAMARPEVAVAGVETYEGVFSGADPASREAPILALLGRTIEAANAIAALTPATEEPFLLTAGGSDFFDLVVEGFKGAVAGRATRIVLRGGCYLTHDSLHYQRCFERMRRRTPSITAIPGGLQSALEVWSIVQSRPEPTRAYCSLGKRDISNDWEPPTPTYWFRPGHHERPHTAPSSWRTAALNDQHLHLEIASEDDIRVGDLMAFGVSHPCTTFDKWRTMMVVDEDRRVIDAIGTWF
jgi:D-serine dehydratase